METVLEEGEPPLKVLATLHYAARGEGVADPVERLGQPAAEDGRHLLRAERARMPFRERLELLQLAHQPAQVLTHALEQLLEGLLA